MRFYYFTNNEPINIPQWTGKLSENRGKGVTGTAEIGDVSALLVGHGPVQIAVQLVRDAIQGVQPLRQSVLLNAKYVLYSIFSSGSSILPEVDTKPDSGV